MIDVKQSNFDLALATALGVLFIFVALAHAAHDLWAATIVYVTLLLMAACLLVHRITLIDQPIRVQGLGLFGAMFLSSGCSFIWAQNHGEAMLRFIDLSGIAVLFVISINIFNKPETIKRFVFVASMAICVEWICHITQTVQFDFLGKTYGTLINANLSALFHLMWVPVLWIFRLQSRWIASMLIMALVNLLLTRSTIGILCGLILLPIMMGWPRLKELRQKKQKIFDGVFSLLILFAAGLFSLKIFELLSGHIFGLKEAQYTSRLIWWKSGFSMFLDHPWFGVGLGNYPSAYLAYKIGEGFHTLYAHSAIITVLAETGLMGLITICLFIGGWFRSFLNLHDRSEKRGFFISVIFGMVFISINIGFEYLGLMMLMAVLMAVCIAGREDCCWKATRLHGIVLLGLLVSASPYAVSPFMAGQQTAAGFQELKQNNTESAKNYFSAAIELNSLASEPYFGLAESHHQNYLKTNSANDQQSALSYIQKAIDANPLSGYLWWTLGRYLNDYGQITEAAQARSSAEQLGYKPPSEHQLLPD